MVNRIMKSIYLGVVLSLTIIFSAPLAFAQSTPHNSYGIVTNGGLGDNYTFYRVAEPSETLTGSLAESTSSPGTFYYSVNPGNLPSPWQVGDDTLIYIARETNAGTNSHAGSYAVMNEDLIVQYTQGYNDCTIRPIPTPTAAAGSGQVNLTWTAAQTDTSATPHGNNISGYNIYRSTSQNTGFSQINTSVVSGTTYADNSGTVGTTYYYAIEPVFRGALALGVFSANSNGIAFPSGGSTLNITTTSLPGGTVGTAYSQTLAAANGTAPYTWTISAGSLPAGLALSTAGVISGTPTAAQTANFTVRVQDAASDSDTQALSITITNGGSSGDFTIAPASAYIGQTIVITQGSGGPFAATPGTITIGGLTANPTAWSTGSITVAVPDGVVGPATVDIDGQTADLPINTGGVVLDDVEGGSVGNWPGAPLANSGYYQYDEGVTPVDANINADGPQAEAAAHGARGMRITYDGSSVTGYGGGWGAALANSLDLTAYNEISFFINWDGSANSFKFALKDGAGHSYFASVSNTVLNALGTYGEVVLQKTAFTEDVDDPSRTTGALDWSDIVSYNITYNTTAPSGSPQYIDSISAGDVNWGDDPNPPVTSEVFVDRIVPPCGPAGTRFTAYGTGFGAAQGQSLLVFENLSTHITYQAQILSWSDTMIVGIVPRVAPAGTYQVKVIKVEITAGNMRALESNPEAYRITSSTPSDNTAVIFPNPFNPLERSVPGTRASGMSGASATIAYAVEGAQNIGIYIYDSTAKLVYQGTTTDTQFSWDGRDNGGNIVADGIYLLRIIDEDTKGLISKGKILVIKSN